MERRAHPRTSCRLQIAGDSRHGQVPYRGQTRDAGLGGAFVLGNPSWRGDEALRLTLACRAIEIQVEAAVVRVTSGGSAIRFVRLPAIRREQLERLLWPTWDKRDLLEGLLLMCRGEPLQDLPHWLHMTTLLAQRRSS